MRFGIPNEKLDFWSTNDNWILICEGANKRLSFDSLRGQRKIGLLIFCFQRRIVLLIYEGANEKIEF